MLDRLALQPDLLRELLELWASGYHLVFAESTRPLQIMQDDPDDNMLFEGAVTLKAKLIVSGDKAVRRVGRYMHIEILTPAEFLARHGGARK